MTNSSILNVFPIYTSLSLVLTRMVTNLGANQWYFMVLGTLLATGGLNSDPLWSAVWEPQGSIVDPLFKKNLSAHSRFMMLYSEHWWK